MWCDIWNNEINGAIDDAIYDIQWDINWDISHRQEKISISWTNSWNLQTRQGWITLWWCNEGNIESRQWNISLLWTNSWGIESRQGSVNIWYNNEWIIRTRQWEVRISKGNYWSIFTHQWAVTVIQNMDDASIETRNGDIDTEINEWVLSTVSWKITVWDDFIAFLNRKNYISGDCNTVIWEWAQWQDITQICSGDNNIQIGWSLTWSVIQDGNNISIQDPSELQVGKLLILLDENIIKLGGLKLQ